MCLFHFNTKRIDMKRMGTGNGRKVPHVKITNAPANRI